MANFFLLKLWPQRNIDRTTQTANSWTYLLCALEVNVKIGIKGWKYLVSSQSAGKRSCTTRLKRKLLVSYLFTPYFFRAATWTERGPETREEGISSVRAVCLRSPGITRSKPRRSSRTGRAQRRTVFLCRGCAKMRFPWKYTPVHRAVRHSRHCTAPRHWFSLNYDHYKKSEYDLCRYQVTFVQVKCLSPKNTKVRY